MSAFCLNLLNTLPVHQGLSGNPGAEGSQGPVGMYVSEILSCQLKYCCLDTELHVPSLSNVLTTCSFLIVWLWKCHLITHFYLKPHSQPIKGAVCHFLRWISSTIKFAFSSNCACTFDDTRFVFWIDYAALL